MERRPAIAPLLAARRDGGPIADRSATVVAASRAGVALDIDAIEQHTKRLVDDGLVITSGSGGGDRLARLPRGAATFVADCLARDSYMLTQHNHDEVAAELLGIDRAAVPTAVSEQPAGSDHRALVIALGLVLSALEARTGKNA
jgi:hypothetical protein